MKNQVAAFLVGIIIGTILGLGGGYLVGQRYEVTATGPSGCVVIKTDRWTGRSWSGNILAQPMTWEEIHR